jgi:hypothetical protein
MITRLEATSNASATSEPRHRLLELSRHLEQPDTLVLAHLLFHAWGQR